jgi:hypothetical protein
MPKLVMTDLWRQSRIDPKYWGELIWCQEWADEVMELGAYPDDEPDQNLIFLSKYMPPTFASAMLRKRLIRGQAMKLWAQRKGMLCV